MRNKNFAVGLFVSIALLLFFIATIWLSGNRGSQPTEDYSMYFDSDVGGLMLGGPVFFLGVKVGSVTAITIIPGNPTRVRVEGRVLKNTPIDKGTYATLAMQGVTGVAVIKLKDEPGDQGALTRLKGEENPVIATRDSGFNALLQKMPDIVEKMDDVLVNINDLLDEDNRTHISQILADISVLTGGLASKRESIEDIPGAVNEALNELRATLVEVRTMASDIKPELATSMQNFSKTSESLASLSARLDGWATTYNDDVGVIMEDGLGQVPTLIYEARSTVREMKKLIKELRDNPSLLIYKPNEDSIDVEK